MFPVRSVTDRYAHLAFRTVVGIAAGALLVACGAQERQVAQADSPPELRATEASEDPVEPDFLDELPELESADATEPPAEADSTIRIPGETGLRRILEEQGILEEAEAPATPGTVAAARPAAAESESSPEDIRAAFEAAKARVAQKTEALAAARETAESALAEVDDVERELRAAESELRRVEEQVAELGPEPDPVSDTELFRMVQRELLEAQALARVAIAAEVRDGRVTLRGVVPDDATRRAAEDIAATLPGVASVANEIRVKGRDSRGG